MCEWSPVKVPPSQEGYSVGGKDSIVRRGICASKVAKLIRPNNRYLLEIPAFSNDLDKCLRESHLIPIVI